MFVVKVYEESEVHEYADKAMDTVKAIFFEAQLEENVEKIELLINGSVYYVGEKTNGAWRITAPGRQTITANTRRISYNEAMRREHGQ